MPKQYNIANIVHQLTSNFCLIKVNVTSWKCLRADSRDSWPHRPQCTFDRRDLSIISNIITQKSDINHKWCVHRVKSACFRVVGQSWIEFGREARRCFYVITFYWSLKCDHCSCVTARCGDVIAAYTIAESDACNTFLRSTFLRHLFPEHFVLQWPNGSDHIVGAMLKVPFDGSIKNDSTL